MLSKEEKRLRKNESALRYRERNRELLKKKNREYRKDQKVKKQINKTSRDRYKKDVRKRILIAARARAKKKGLEFDIDIEDIIIPARCPIFNIKLKVAEGVHKESSPSLDRIDNTKGYVKGNVAIISRKANSLKRDLTIEDMERLTNYISRRTRRRDGQI